MAKSLYNISFNGNTYTLLHLTECGISSYQFLFLSDCVSIKPRRISFLPPIVQLLIVYVTFHLLAPGLLLYELLLNTDYFVTQRPMLYAVARVTVYLFVAIVTRFFLFTLLFYNDI